MKLSHAIIIGIAIIVAAVGHATVTFTLGTCRSSAVADTSAAELVAAYGVQSKAMEVAPKAIDLGGTTLLYVPQFQYRGTHVTVDYTFFEFADGRLKKIVLTAGD